MFLVVALIAGVLGVTGIAGLSAQIAWILFVVGLILAIVSFVFGRRGRDIAQSHHGALPRMAAFRSRLRPRNFAKLAEKTAHAR